MLKKNTVFLSFDSQKELDDNAVKFIVEKAEDAIKERGIFSKSCPILDICSKRLIYFLT